MSDLQYSVMETLNHAIERLRNVGVPGDVTLQLRRLIEKASERCVVAVVGRVKAGKSTFANAFLGDKNLAKTDVNEATATINYFRGGDPDRPIRCHWRNNVITNVDRQFVDHLQSNDEKILREAEGIDYLEYFVRNSYLEKITLVDTPGISSTIAAHQNRVAAWLNLQNQMREHRHQDTQTIGSQADAVIYVIGETARTDAQAFLDEFKYVTQGTSRSFNAIGVMAQIDLNDEIINRREELSKKIASQLHGNLNTVIPVSAGVQLALDDLLAHNRAGLKEMLNILRPTPPKEPIPSKVLDELLASSELYLETECSLTIDERKKLRGEMHWRVFVTVVRIIADTSLDENAIVEKLQDIAGFNKLRQVLEQHFVERSTLLHGFSIVNAALKIVENVKYLYLPELQRHQEEDEARRKRFLYLLQQIRNVSPVAQELTAFVQERLPPYVDLGEIIDEVEREIRLLKYELENYDQDFVALQLLENNSGLFTPGEREELRQLFGLYNLEMEKRLLPEQATISYLGQRLDYWSWKIQVGRTSVVVSVAQQAIRRYGMYLEQPQYRRG